MAKIIGAAIIAGGGGSQYPKLRGTWVFNATLSDPSFLGLAAYDVPIQATSNSLDITAMRFELNTGTDAMQILYMLTDSSVNAYGSTDDTWTNAAYRVITFTTPFKRDINPDFYDWFVSNAVRKKGNVVVNITKSGNYKLWKVDGVKYNSAQTLSLNYGDTITITGSNPMYYGNAITLNGTTVNSTSAGKTQNPYNLLLIDDVYNMDLYGYYGHTSGTPTSTILYGTCKITSSNN